jgi:hypothetical protein
VALFGRAQSEAAELFRNRHAEQTQSAHFGDDRLRCVLSSNLRFERHERSRTNLRTVSSRASSVVGSNAIYVSRPGQAVWSQVARGPTLRGVRVCISLLLEVRPARTKSRVKAPDLSGTIRSCSRNNSPPTNVWRDTARNCAQEQLMPRVLEANRHEKFEREIMNEFGAL